MAVEEKSDTGRGIECQGGGLTDPRRSEYTAHSDYNLRTLIPALARVFRERSRASRPYSNVYALLLG